MGINVIPNDLPKLTGGERKVLEKIRSIYKTSASNAYLYIQPKIRNLVPDFILIDPEMGVTILEIKDWGISYICQADRRKVYLNDDKVVDNPLFKANQYYHAAQGLFSMNENLLNDYSQLKFNLHSIVIFPNLTFNEIEENNLTAIFDQNPSKYLTSNELSTLKLDDLFCEEITPIDDDDVIALRTILFPEIKIHKTADANQSNQELIKSLDTEQERFAKRIPYGHYMVTGVPGSGKTVILLARAIHLVREHPDWKIKILTYNKSLQTKIENKLNILSSELSFMNVRIENIDVSTFHKFAMNIANVGVPNNPSQDWWNKELPSLALEHVKPSYDAILIDEYQDFHDDWIKLCVQACQEHTYVNNNNKEVVGKNLFLAGDRLQSIYNKNEHSWKSLGINMQGRSTLLKKSYRSGSEHIDLALKFLKQEDSLKEEVEKFYCPENELLFDNNVENGIVFVENGYQAINEMLKDLIYKVGYHPDDILILCKEWEHCRKLKQQLDSPIRSKSEVSKHIIEGQLILTTYHSSKGLEAPIVFLVDVDKFELQQIKENEIQLRKLLYVGMTRASERLYIHATDLKKASFAEKISSCLSLT